MTSLSKICRSECTLNWRSRHEYKINALNISCARSSVVILVMTNYVCIIGKENLHILLSFHEGTSNNSISDLVSILITQSFSHNLWPVISNFSTIDMASIAKFVLYLLHLSFFVVLSVSLAYVSNCILYNIRNFREA